jgi:hypothetical protein
MIPFENYQTEDRRLVLLRALSNAAQYRANAYLLRAYCDGVGHVVSAERLETDLAWLAEQSLVSIEREPVIVATLTARGLDVATGRAKTPGVKRPMPGDA